MPNVTFNNQQKVFYNFITTRVENYFKEHNIQKTGDRSLYVKSAILITTALVVYVALLSGLFHPVLALLLCAVFGLTQAAIGFNVMHDANHGSFSQKKWVNELMALTANMMGVSSWLWKQKHNVIHHTYTNVEGVDDDIATTRLLRMCPYQKKYKIHRFQNYYCIPVYGLTSLMWTFIADFRKYFTRKIQDIRLRKMTPREHMIFWLSKIFYVFFYIALPIYLLGFVPFLIGFLIMHITLGITLAVVFQLAHVVEATHFVDGQSESLEIEKEWAVHQVQTTANFATGNKLISWYTGGLNFQVEHHLFPKISHVHYPAIQGIVQEACAVYDIRYNHYPSMLAALRSHLRLMKQLGI